MKLFSYKNITKFIIPTFLIIGIILLCPVNPVSSAETSYNVSAASVSSHSINMNGGDSDHSQTHLELGSHIANLASSFNYSILLFLFVFTILVFLSSRLLFLINYSYLTKLNYWQHRYRVIIKPKLETRLHRWLNLLGGSFALSF